MGPSNKTPPPSAVAARQHPEVPPPGTVLGPRYARCFARSDRHDMGLHPQLTVPDGVVSGSARAEALGSLRVGHLPHPGEGSDSLPGRCNP